MATATRPANFVEGTDYLSPVTHVIGLGYYDGVTNGVLKTADGSAYAFDMTDERYNPDGLDSRTFELAPLPAPVFDEVVRAIEPHITPRWPCWVPLWKFPSEETRAAVEEQLDQLLARAEKPVWRVESRSLIETVSAAAIK
jgi:hypothetical protein